jgi:hypothetical protein
MHLSAGTKVRGALAGNGGEMAVTAKALNLDTTSSKRKSTKGKATGSRTRSKAKSKEETALSCAIGPKEITAPGEIVLVRGGGGSTLAIKARGKGVKRLQQAAEEQLEICAERLAVALAVEALHGKLGSAKMLVELADGAEETSQEAEESSRLTLAQRLERDKAWEGPLDEDSGEMGEGGVERE